MLHISHKRFFSQGVRIIQSVYTSLVLGWVGSRVFKTDLASIFHFEQSNGALLCVSLEPFFIVKKIENWLWCTSFILKVFILMVFGIETSRLTDLIYDLYWAHLLWFLYIIPTIYLDTEHWRRCVAALTWLPGMSHWNFFKLLFTTCYYFFFSFHGNYICQTYDLQMWNS